MWPSASGSRARRATAAAALLLVPVVLAACGVGASADGDAARSGGDCEPGKQHEAGKTHVSLRVADSDRRYLLYVPRGYDGVTPHSVLLTFHGSGDAPDARTRATFEFDEIWNASPSPLPPDMVVAAPQAQHTSWDTSASSPDAELAAAVLDDVERRLCVDPARVFATGISSGGMMASRLACRLSGRLAAVGTAIGMLYPFVDSCADASAVPVVSVAGEEDPVFRASQLELAHESWAESNGCDGDPSVESVPRGVTLTRYEGCDGGATVALHVVHGMGHQQALRDCGHIPSFVRENVCFQTDLDFRETQLEFFARHPRS